VEAIIKNASGAFIKLILKFGLTGNLSSGNPGTQIIFNQAFPTAPLFAAVIPTTYTGTAEANNCVSVLNPSNMTIILGGASAQPYRWYAIGY
jgi:hypothetical protein